MLRASTRLWRIMRAARLPCCRLWREEDWQQPSMFTAISGSVGARSATNAPPGSFAISGHDAPHAHMIAADPGNRFVLAVDLGQDRIYVYRFDGDSGKLSPSEAAPFVSFPSGDGPRHFVFHPNGRWIYVLGEESSTIAFFHYDATRGTLALQQTISSLPEDLPAPTSPRKWSSRRMAGSSMLPIACMTRSRSVQSIATAGSRSLVKSRRWEIILGTAHSIQAASFSTCAISVAITSPAFRFSVRPDCFHSRAFIQPLERRRS